MTHVPPYPRRPPADGGGGPGLSFIPHFPSCSRVSFLRDMTVVCQKQTTYRAGLRPASPWKEARPGHRDRSSQGLALEGREPRL